MLASTIRGRVVKLGDFIDTDVIAPVRWMREGLDVLRFHSMEAIRPEFHKEINKGDIIVAGRNFGCGSHREQATEIMHHLGVSAIVADSVARLYFRNAIAFGFPLFSISGVSELAKQGDNLEISVEERSVTIKNLTRGGELKAPPLPEIMALVLDAGGIYKLLKERLRQLR